MNHKQNGLTCSEAKIKLQTDGLNELPAAKRQTIFSSIMNAIRQGRQFGLLLLAATALALLWFEGTKKCMGMRLVKS